MSLFEEGPQALRADGYPHATEDVCLELSCDGPAPHTLMLRSDDERSESVRAFLVQSPQEIDSA
jgi:hypothetical protein